MTEEKRRFARYSPDFLLLVVDLLGTYVFAVEGAMAAIRANLDLLGLLVLSFATALGGGIIRDMLIGAVPPNSIRDWRYGATAFAGGGTVFFFYEFFRSVPQPLMITLDAAGLALFAVAGADKALEFGINPLIAVLMGGLTGVGGGTVRDILLAQVPAVLRTDVYASAALAGAAAVVMGVRMKMPRGLAMSLGAGVCFTLRMVAVWQHWNLPRVMVH
ncbi:MULTISPECIES: trimeric intracellular cation channel family protein [Acidobacteriaceae]|uniref:trimeric intracellular cation channel family protein n=1 Tax=Acidobacteriaceae TaxID=204434 RepID=UPI00131CC736|nr:MULTISPECIES: TRIC cation channel family protein [Acidobacteriaceae]MDW5266029.1 TRIC cation channel family protein [Edaphobacter sp.]